MEFFEVLKIGQYRFTHEGNGPINPLYYPNSHSVNLLRDDGSTIYAVFDLDTQEIFTVEIFIGDNRFVWISPATKTIKLDDVAFQGFDSTLIEDSDEMIPETLKMKYM